MPFIDVEIFFIKAEHILLQLRTKSLPIFSFEFISI